MQPSHQYQDVDAVDGDVSMQIRGERGGRREQERKRKRQLGDDVDMVDAEVGQSAVQCSCCAGAHSPLLLALSLIVICMALLGRQQ